MRLLLVLAVLPTLALAQSKPLQRATIINKDVDEAISVRCVNASGTDFESCAGSAASGLTNAELRASPVPVSGTLTCNAGTGTLAVSGPLTDAQLRAANINVSVANPSIAVTGTFWQATQPVSGTVSVSNFPASQAVTGTFWPATQPVSGTLTCNAGSGTLAVSGPLTDAQLRATAVPVSGTFFQATQPVSIAAAVNVDTTSADQITVANTSFPIYQTTGPSRWQCNLDNLAASLTECRAAAGAGTSHYITDIIVQTSTATSGTFAVRSGTGTNCGTATTGVFPGGASAVLNAPINTQPMAVINLSTPIKLTAAHALCVIGTATNTIRIFVQGYTAP